AHAGEAGDVQLRRQAAAAHARLDVTIAADAPQTFAPADGHAAREDRGATYRLAAAALDGQPGQRTPVRVVAVQPVVARRHVAGVDVRHQPDDLRAVSFGRFSNLEFTHTSPHVRRPQALGC